MAAAKQARNPNGRSTVYQDEHGEWHGYVTVGVKDNGKPDRRHRRGKTKTAVTQKVRKLEQERDQGKVRNAGATWTVEHWLRHWLEDIMAPPAITENAWDAYANAVRVHLIPGIGAHRLHTLKAEHLERLYRTMTNSGASPGNAHQVHRTVRTALNEAVKRKHITENPASIARSPKIDETEVEPYSVEQVKRILETAHEGRNSARWAIALALGLRQGEVLGLHWEDIDLDAGTLVVRRSRLRPKWRHGCAKPCGHKHGGHCPRRIALRDESAGTKSRAGRRGMGLPDELIELLKRHRDEQNHEREKAGQLWQESPYVFTTPTGQPLNPRTDLDQWRKLLEKANVADRRLHDARHTAATVLLLLGVPERTVMSVMGWSNTGMAARYQHVTATIRRDVADRVGGLLWEPGAAPGGGDGPTSDAER